MDIVQANYSLFTHSLFCSNYMMQFAYDGPISDIKQYDLKEEFDKIITENHFRLLLQSFTPV